MGTAAKLIAQVGEADRWRCWLCWAPVDPGDRSNGPWSPTVDHVRPRSRRGGNDLDNLRLAHRRCNTRRSSRDPEIRWPDDLWVAEPAPLFPTALRLARRGGHEVVGVTDPVTAPKAAAWLGRRLTHTFRGRWRVDQRRRGDVVLLDLTCLEPPTLLPDPRKR